MINATRYRKAATGSISLVVVGLLLERNLSFYRLEEILISWMLFSLALVSLALVILAGIFVFCAGQCLRHWASMAARDIAAVALRPSERYSGMVPTEGRTEPAKEFSNADA